MFPSHPIRLIATDVDGTLLDSRYRIPEVNRDAVAAARRAGLRVALCTGKTYQAIRDVIEELDLGRGEHVVLNGGGLYDPAAARVEVLRSLPPGGAEEAERRFREAGLPVAYYVPDGIRVLASDGTDFLEVAVRMGEPEPRVLASAEELADLRRRVPVVKLLTVLPQDRPDAAGVEARLAGGAPPGVRFVRTGPLFVEAIPADGGKAVGLRRLAARLGVRREEILAIGDAESDLSLFAAAGVRVAVGNAVPELRRAADRVVASHDEGGVAQAIREIALAPLEGGRPRP
ncbi:MAG: HAD-IIB family hydrolase [Bacillota bacterium]|nr:HAD-IIB family hydrolase [Bacillota bacterium]